MAWPGGSKPDPKEILGMEQDEFKTRLDKINEIDGIKAAQEAQNNILAGMKASLDSITAGFQQRQQQAQQQQHQQQNGNNELTDFIDDPDKAVAERINQRMAPLAQLALDTRASIEFDKVSRTKVKNDKGILVPKYPYWDAYAGEIQELLAAQNVQARSNPATIENAYHIIVGKHADEIANDRAKGTGMFAVESGSNSGVAGMRGSSNQNNNTNDPSETDKKQAAKFGIPIEKYMESKKGLTYVGI